MTAPVVLAAGGTGGHMFPAEALARVLADRGCPVVHMTDSRGKAFSASVPEVQVERLFIPFPKGGFPAKLKAAAGMAVAFCQARRRLARLRPCVVVGFGGYPSVPAVLAAWTLRIPVVLHEQNAVLGRANRLLARRARLLAAAFNSVERVPPGLRMECVGNPVRPAIAALAGRHYEPPRPDGPFHVFITGGSQGAAVFGMVIPAAAGLLPEDQRRRLRVVHQVRPEQLEDVRRAWQDMGVEAEVSAFFTDMPERLAWSHLMISRSGASTLAELAMAGRPAVLVPYPAAADDHQSVNARIITGNGAGWLMPQPEFTPGTLSVLLADLMSPEGAGYLEQAARAMKSHARPDAAEKLADAVLSPGRKQEAGVSDRT
ncbi:MAG: undecaprenyldiphospho-muramoylpentapeptide beta-N-acetylglucosaminyltransferase [Pseudomonadota bacterium]|nr:undecaprenyldiphospho-muramoylpentapeptide beta-N-acetylglucosaminyltransferase [Pseudomonadota bacterium]